MDRTGNARLENDAEENHPRYQLDYWPAQLDITRTYVSQKEQKNSHSRTSVYKNYHIMAQDSSYNWR